MREGKRGGKEREGVEKIYRSIKTMKKEKKNKTQRMKKKKKRECPNTHISIKSS